MSNALGGVGGTGGSGGHWQLQTGDRDEERTRWYPTRLLVDLQLSQRWWHRSVSGKCKSFSVDTSGEAVQLPV